ncbi:MAG: hypothetical protein R6V25_15955, partial [Desulfatiglandales bacterium]
MAFFRVEAGSKVPEHSHPHEQIGTVIRGVIAFNGNLHLHMGNQTTEMYYFGVGHTTGDIVVYFPEEKTTFIGDQVFKGRPHLIHS